MGKKFKFGKLEVEEDEFDRQYIEATKRGQISFDNAMKAQTARYDSQTKRLVIELPYQVILLTPINLFQGLSEATENEVRDVQLWLNGIYLHWGKLDIDLRVSSLIRGIFGTKRWMLELNKKFDNEPIPKGKIIT